MNVSNLVHVMAEEEKTLNLRVNDLVLMNVVDIGEQGPVFGIIDRVGSIEVGDDLKDSPTGTGNIEQAVTDSGNVGRTESNDLLKESPKNSTIAELEERRAALDIVIQELKLDAADAEMRRLKDGASKPSNATQTSDLSSVVAEARSMRRYRDQALDQH